MIINKLNTKLVLKTMVSNRLFLQLLKDDFLKSELTNFYYFTENTAPAPKRNTIRLLISRSFAHVYSILF
jgi:hypothetical protein